MSVDDLLFLAFAATFACAPYLVLIAAARWSWTWIAAVFLGCGLAVVLTAMSYGWMRGGDMGLDAYVAALVLWSLVVGTVVRCLLSWTPSVAAKRSTRLAFQSAGLMLSFTIIFWAG